MTSPENNNQKCELRRVFLVAVSLCCVFFGGEAYSGVNGLTPADYTNVGVVAPSGAQTDILLSNNTDSVVVLPKGLLVEKVADISALSAPIAAGDTITYTVTATNLGLLGLTNVSINDAIIPNLTLISGDTNTDSVLDANEVWVWRGDYQVTQSDIDSNGGGDGDIDNTVTVSTAELAPQTDSVEIAFTQEPSFSVTKVVDQASITALSTLDYQITVTNTGNQTLSAVTLTDTLPDGNIATLSGPVADTGQPGVLDPGETWEFTTAYTATQADIDAGALLSNSVSVVTAETGASPQVASAETTILPAPALSVSKLVDQASLNAPGTLTYTITLENTGNVSLTGVTPTDTLPDGSTGTLTGPVTDTGAVGVLDVAEVWTYNISYPVSQAVIDAGNPLVNTVEVTSNETGALTVSDTATTTIDNQPSFTVTKTVDKASVSIPELLGYVIEVENTGNATLTNIVVTDQLSNGTTLTLIGPVGDAGTIGALDVGENWLYTAVYDVSQADIDAGIDLTNTFTIDTAELDPQADSAVTIISTAPDLEVTKTVDLASVSAPATLNYVISIENTGNVSLSNVTTVDTLPDSTIATLVGPLADTGVAGVIDVGETWEYTTTFLISQSDIDDAQPRDNTVVVTTDETGADLFSAVATTTIITSPSFTVEKTVDQAQITEPGTLSYDIVVSNTGNVTLNNISLDDTLPDGTTAVVTGPVGDVGVADALDVGEVWTYNATFDVTQSDIDAGAALVNSVVITTDEAGTGSDSATTVVDQVPGIRIVKTAVEAEFFAAGDFINYAFLIENTGNLLLDNVVVSDPITDAGSLRCLPPGLTTSAQLSNGPFVLGPGEQMNCTALRTVTFDDVLATGVDNLATVSSEDPQGNVVDASSQLISVPLAIIAPVATNNSFNSPVSGVAVTLDGGADDTDVNGDIDISTVSFVANDAVDTDADQDNDTLVVAGEGVWVIDNVTGNVTFTPEPGFTADPATVSYVISDRSGQVSNVAVLSVNYPQTAPVAEDDLKINPAAPAPTNPTVVNVLADNGSGADSDAENDLLISSISFVDPAATDTDGDGDADNLAVAGEGIWQIDNSNGEVTFTPEAGFFADPTPVNYVIADINGLVSNEATITVEYPQTAPIAVDDEMLEQPLAQPVTVVVLANDSDPEDNLDPTTVRFIDPVTGAPVSVLPVADEGVWRVDIESGEVTFTPDTGFIINPTPVDYVVSDSTGLESNRATVTITFELPARLEGTVWLDADRDGQVGFDEDRKAGWSLQLLNAIGDVVATTTTDADGNYLFQDLIPGVYTVELFNENGVFIDSAQTQGPVFAGETVLLPLPVDPSGVVYDSIARVPVEGVTLNLVNASGSLVDELCLREMQQGQTTLADGLYAFDINPGADPSCGVTELYRIEIASVPDAFRPNFSSIIRQVGAQDCGSPEIGCAVSATFDSDPLETGCTVDSIISTDACEVQAQPDAPQFGEDTRYFVEFEIASGDQNVIFNHIPIDAIANDAEIVLTKNVDQRETFIGSLVQYTVTAENLKQTPAFGIRIIDTPPAGFSVEQSSVLLTRRGADGVLNTADDVASSIDTVIDDGLIIGELDFEPEEQVQITYVLRVGAGVVNGSYENRVVANGPNGETSNIAIASVEVVNDTVISQATLIGKVFFDRDSDGVQDPADATGIELSSIYYGSISLADIPARGSVENDPLHDTITINMPRTADNRIRISTREGTRINLDHDGNITEAHIGDRARGINAQNLRVCTRYTSAVPLLADGTSGSEPVDVLQIELSNHGIAESGIPAVRIASVSGLIIETDSHGRYNVPDVDTGSIGTSRNYILKVDPASLVSGARFTTENPYVLRLDSNALNKMNFGVLLPEKEDKFAAACEPQIAAANAAEVAKPKVVVVNLGSVFFDTDVASIREDQRGVVEDIIKAIRLHGSGEITVSAHTDSRQSYEYNIALAEQRAKSIRDAISRALGEDLMSDVSVSVDPTAFKESDQ